MIFCGVYLKELIYIILVLYVGGKVANSSGTEPGGCRDECLVYFYILSYSIWNHEASNEGFEETTEVVVDINECS